jgi:hypothetical protein
LHIEEQYEPQPEQLVGLSEALAFFDADNGVEIEILEVDAVGK